MRWRWPGVLKSAERAATRGDHLGRIAVQRRSRRGAVLAGPVLRRETGRQPGLHEGLWLLREAAVASSWGCCSAISCSSCSRDVENYQVEVLSPGSGDGRLRTRAHGLNVSGRWPMVVVGLVVGTKSPQRHATGQHARSSRALLGPDRRSAQLRLFGAHRTRGWVRVPSVSGMLLGAVPDHHLLARW